MSTKPRMTQLGRLDPLDIEAEKTAVVQREKFARQKGSPVQERISVSTWIYTTWIRD